MVGAADATVNITFKVKPPAGTPADEKLYLAGDSDALGGAQWKADGLKLTRGDDGIYSGKVALAKDKQLEYKVTRGSWETVEKNADGSELNNRTFTPTKDATVEIEVKRWADAAKVSPGTDKPAEKKSTRSGDIRVHAKFPSKFVEPRDVLVWLPPGYDVQTQARYPVLYMQDGQNVFDAATSFTGVEWRADETATRLVEERAIMPMIIVAIYNTKDRIEEYTLVRDNGRGGGKGGSHGAAYMKFVAEELKPYIDATYRTSRHREDTAVGGSSLGALISLEICRRYPQFFGNCIATSSALWWGDYQLINQLKQHDQDNGTWIRNCRFWIDAGTMEGQTQGERNAMLGGLLQLEARLIFAGLKKGTGYDVLIVNGAQHSEQAWADRFDKALIFLFKSGSAPAPYNPVDGYPPPTPAPDPAAPHDVAAR